MKPRFDVPSLPCHHLRQMKMSFKQQTKIATPRAPVGHNKMIFRTNIKTKSGLRSVEVDNINSLIYEPWHC